MLSKIILSLTILCAAILPASAQTANTPTVAFNALPFNDAIVIVKGSGTRKLALFEDPNCGFCKQFENELAPLTNVTLYVFLYPILGDDSVSKSTSIWCSDNRAYTWQNWMINRAPFPARSCGASPVYRNMTLGKNYQFVGTPTIVFSDNTKMIGSVSSFEIEKKLTTIYGQQQFNVQGTHPNTSSSTNSVNKQPQGNLFK